MRQITTFLLTVIFCMSISMISRAELIRLRIPDSSAVEKDTIVLPIYVDSSLTGHNVMSFQLDISYNNNYLKVIDVLQAGALSEIFSGFDFHKPNSEEI